MRSVLIDTSTLLDLVLYYQQRHRRNRCIASSAAAAVEALLVYERPLVESSSATAIGEADGDSRFLRFYCDDAGPVAAEQFRTLLDFCVVLELSDGEVTEAYDHALATISEVLETIVDPDDLRAYELYDYLPYHLGEDPSAIECRVTNPSVADLELIRVAGAAGGSYFSRAAECLRDRRHPTRAAWALPMLRLFYYQEIQGRSGAHFLPHATKSTIAFGREAETVTYRRLLEYCTETFRSSYLAVARRRLGGLMIVLPVPGFADALLRRAQDWGQLLGQLSTVRNDSTAVAYRSALSTFMDLLEEASSLEERRPEIENAYRLLEIRCREWCARLGLAGRTRNVRIAVPFSRWTGDGVQEPPNRFMLIHDLFSATGIAGTAGMKSNDR